ncbi:MAG: sugar-binding protein [Armatimonadota bacterium]|nr:sugar-binding protein [Armatimonadota bacterium]
MLASKWPNRAIVVAAAILLIAAFAVTPLVAEVSVHSSGRYYQDSNGKPVFLIGYYDWAATVDGYYIDQPSRYDTMITLGAPYKVNYIRMVLGGNKVNGSSNPPSYNGQQAPVPWLLVNGKADMNQWDPAFWTGVKAQCQFAKANGVIIHFGFFDGVSMRTQGGASYGYSGSFWNPANQTASFYPNPDFNGNGQIDDNGEFYQTTNFNNNTGIGYYQRALIDKGCSELAAYDNVFLEVGNELLGSSSAWNTTVISYIKTKTAKPITTVGYNGSGMQGYSDHIDDTVAELKASLASMVGLGFPAWVDPDGSGIAYLPPDGIRQCYWTSLASGAAAYGGFTTDFWTWPTNPPPGFNTLKGVYCKNLQDFLTTTACPFWTMVPQSSLVTNSTVNCCIANQGSTYLAYILSDATADVNLTSVSGNAYYKLYNPASGTYSGQSTVAGEAWRSFSRPAGASDWVIYIYTTLPSHGQLNVKAAGTYTIDGNPNDWNFGNYSSMIYGGGSGAGDIALTGYDLGLLHYASYAGVLPTSATDHTAKVYTSHDSTYEYFLVRCDDDDMRYSAPTSSNWANDCVEFYMDPANSGGSTAISNSTSDIQLVIDANNQKNVYMTTSGYATQILNGVTSGVQRDSTGWWLEARITKSALDPDLPSSGTFGLDFNFRDNDNDNDAALTTVYTWNDASGSGFPSKIPDNWGDAFQIAPGETPYGGSSINLPGTIQAENFDNGGEGVAYHDTESTNYGGAFRTSEGVDIASTYDTGGGYEVGWVQPNEWLNYMVYVNATRAYDINMRVSGGGGNFHINMDGQNVTGTRTTPNTGSWGTYATYTVPSIQLAAGSHVLTVVAETAGFNLNYIDVVVPPVYWNTLGTLQNIGSGTMPQVCVDSSNNIHVAYAAGNGVTYKKYNSSWTLQTSETITSPSGGAYWPHMMLDSNAVPHLVFTEGVTASLPYASYLYYTNRIGGTWKSVVTALNLAGTGNSVWNPRLALYSTYAYIGSQYGYNQSLIGRIDRLTNLSSTPSVDASVNTSIRSLVAATTNGNIFAVGRNTLSTGVQEYNSGLGLVGGPWSMTNGTGKAGAPAAAWTDKYNIVHMVAWGIMAGGSGQCADRCGLIYNHTGRRNGDGSFYNSINGMLGDSGAVGPDPSSPTGWWNDDVAPAICRDGQDVVYVAWRDNSASGEGRISKVDDSSWTQSCKSSLCGDTTCTGTQFAQTLTRRRWWNCELAPAATGGGVYVAYENGGTCYIQPVGVTAAVDTTAPGNITSFSVRAEQSMNVLTWTNPGDSDLSGIKIVFKTTGYPTSTTDGNTCYDGLTTSYTHNGLTNGTTYYYKAFAHDAAPNYASGATASGTPATDSTAPGNVTSFTATPGDTQVSLSWTNPTDTDLYGIKIMFKTTGYPTGTADGTQCYNGMGTSYVHTGLTNGATYYYKAFAYDEVPNYATGATASTSPYDPQTPYSGVISLPGTIQAENFDNGGEGIAYHDTTSGNTPGAYRSTDVDIETCSDTGGGYDISYVAAGEWLEYKVNVTTTGDYSIGVRVALNTGAGGYRVKIDGTDVTGARNFAATGGWQTWTTIITPSVYLTAGQHVLQLYVDSGAANMNYVDVISRGPDAVSIDLDSTNVEDGMTCVTGVGDGDTVAWSAAGHNFRENVDYPDVYMYFTVTDGWAYQGSKQDVYITCDYYDIGTATLGLDYDSTSSSYQHVNGPTLGNTLTFKSYTFHVTNAYFGNRENGGADFRFTISSQQEWGIDTVGVYQSTADVTPPANVTGFTATPGNQQNSLSWTNPTDPDFTGTMIRFKTTGYPTSASDGTHIYDSSGTSYNHTGLTNGTTYYYKAFSHDVIPNYASGSQTSGTPADTTPPANVTSFIATSGDLQNSLSWTNPTDTDLTGIKIMFKTTGYPTSVTDGTQCYDGLGTSYAHTALTNGTTYYYKAFAHDGVPNYASGATASAVPADVTAPANVTSFAAVSGDTQNVLSWNNPADADFAGVKVMFKTTGYPTSATDGTQVYNGMLQGVTHTGLTNGTTYYYKAFAYDEVPNYASGAQSSAIPLDVTPPGNATSFTATPGASQNYLSWVNPADADFAGVKIMFKTTGYPTSATDGTQAYSGTGTSTMHTGLTNGTTYYYKAFAFDEVPNYASGAQTSGMPVGVLTINTKSAANLNLVINANSSDWNIATNFTTKARGGMSEIGDYAIVGFDGGTCYRGSYVQALPTSATDHTAKVYSFHDQQYLYFLVRCDDDDIQYGNPTSANWANDCVEFYIDPSHDHGSTSMSNSTSDCQLVIDANNQKNVYMTTTGYATQILNGVTSAVVRDGTGWWMECKILKSVLDTDLPNSGSFGIDFNFRDNDNNNNTALTTVYMWRESSTEGYPTKIPDHWGDASLATLAADTTAPAAVTSFTATPGDMQNGLSWTNPGTADWSGTMVRFKTTGYPTGTADGTQIYNGTGASYNHTGLTNGTTYYYAAYSYDEVPNYATAAQASGVPADTTAPSNVTNFAATPGAGQISLSWTNPGSDFTGTMVRFKTTGYPTDTADGTQIYDSSGTSYVHTGLTNGVTYYYKAFAHDGVPNYASGAQISASPGPITISNSTFDSDANGWTITTWRAHSAYGYGTMAWNSGAGNGGGGMRSTGAGGTDSTDRCTREGGMINKTISTSGYSNIKVSYDLHVNTLGGNYTGAGTGSCGGAIDHDLIDEQVTVYYSTNGGTSWTEAEYTTRSTLLASYQTYGTRTIDLTGVTACNNNASFALKFRWQLNTTSDTADVDNIKVTAN